MLSDKVKAQLSEIVDSVICCADVLNYDSVDEFQEEICGSIEVTRELTEQEYIHISELVEEYWNEHGGNDDREEDEDEDEE